MSKSIIDTTDFGLVGAETCLRLVFPDEASRPCLRYFRELQRNRLVPFKKIGRRTFFDPIEVRRSLDRQFSVHARGKKNPHEQGN